MKKIMFGVLFFAVILVSGCEQFTPGDDLNDPQESPRSKNIGRLPIPVDQGQVRDHYAPVIEEFEIDWITCGSGGGSNNSNSSGFSCNVGYRIRATDDVGIRGVFIEKMNPFGGDAGVGEFPWPGVKEYNFNGTWSGLTIPGNYSIRYTITDFWDKTAEETKYFSLP